MERQAKPLHYGQDVASHVRALQEQGDFRGGVNSPENQRPTPGEGEVPEGLIFYLGEGQGNLIESRKPSDLAGFSFKVEAKPILEDLEDLDSSSLDQLGFENVTEYLLAIVLHLVSVEEVKGSTIPLSTLLAVPEIVITPDMLDLRIKTLAGIRAMDVLLERWKEKGLM